MASGSPLLNVRRHITDGGETIGKIYGPEKNITTYNLARMNMLLLEPARPQHLAANHCTPCINADEQSRLAAEFFSKVTRFICEIFAATKIQKPFDPDDVASRSKSTSTTYPMCKSFNCYTAEPGC